MADRRHSPATMTERDVALLLAFITSVDSRMIPRDDDTAAARRRAWMVVLEGVHPDFAMDVARRVYRGRTPDRPLAPGDIRQMWLTYRERQEPPPTPDPSDVIPEPPWFRPAVAAAAEAAREVRKAYAPGQQIPQAIMDRATSEAVDRVKIEHGWIPREVAADLRERDCGVKGCHCDHVECRGGWMDSDLTVTHRDRQYAAVKRCRHCEDSLRMRGEN